MNTRNNIDKIDKVEVYYVSLEQNETYLGPVSGEENLKREEYFIRESNRTVYPKKNKSIVVRVLTKNGVEGWGETYGLVAGDATVAIIKNLFTDFLIGRNPLDVVTIYEDLYDLMRVRAYHGGFYHDALAAVDIALWDIFGKTVQQPLARLLGGVRRTKIPAYVSGLPKSTIEERCKVASNWQEKGFNAFKFALPMADQGGAEEMKQLRKTLGEKALIACDMHWARTRSEAVSLIEDMMPYRPWYIEAPIYNEDINGLSWITKKTKATIAVGEEWRTIYDAKIRIDMEACHIVQPEMGHTGITQFMRIANYAHAHNLLVMPHATIGSGIFLAASLQASSSIQNIASHEFQHTIFNDFTSYNTGNMTCESGFFNVPNGYGIGVEPTDEMKSKMKLL